MHLSKHAQIRSRQRGIPERTLEVIYKYGIQENASGGVTKYRFTGKSFTEAEHHLKQLLQDITKLKNRCIVVDEHTLTVITTY